MTIAAAAHAGRGLIRLRRGETAGAIEDFEKFLQMKA
jgi:regulator of sirC expression with transglutaminase-like and TPR domain